MCVEVVALHGSHYGMSNISIHLRNVNCIGNEYSITECAKTINSLSQGKALISQVDVAGVDCVYDEPAPPPCIIYLIPLSIPVTVAIPVDQLD